MEEMSKDIAGIVRGHIQRVDPKAKLLLYGSRARGSAAHDSDWDFLILFDTRPDQDQLRQIRDLLFSVECDTGEVIVPIFHTREEWESPAFRAMPFHENVEREAIVL